MWNAVIGELLFVIQNNLLQHDLMIRFLCRFVNCSIRGSFGSSEVVWPSGIDVSSDWIMLSLFLIHFRLFRPIMCLITNVHVYH